MIPFLDLSLATAELRAEIDPALAIVLDSGRYILGPEVDQDDVAFQSKCPSVARSLQLLLPRNDSLNPVC